MFRRLMLGVGLLSALVGCVSTPPRGSFVEFHAGLTPITRRVKCEATYALVAKDQPLATGPLLTQSARKGERIGFRREDDGSVSAIAPGTSLPLVPGAYEWVVVPGSVAPWRKRARVEIGEPVVGVLCVAGFLAAMIGLGLLVGGDDNSASPEPQGEGFGTDHFPNRNTH